MKSCGVHHRLTIRTYLVSICLIISPLIGDVTAVTTESVVGDCEHLNGCNGNGRCDFKTRSCECFDGFGSKRDVTPIDIPDCSLRVCPPGNAWVDMPTGVRSAHKLAECSNAGTCDRETGRCQCFDGFAGNACQRTLCPNHCSGHGRCLRVRDIHQEPNAFPFGHNDGSYTGDEDETTWAENKIYACVCDSSWKVGYKPGEVQEPEFFGPDCSLKHCPSGDDPLTDRNEENCFLHDKNGAVWRGPVNDDGSPKNEVLEKGTCRNINDCKSKLSSDTWGKNKEGPDNCIDPKNTGTNCGQAFSSVNFNKCHVDCSNRGLCNHETGQCQCFRGYYSENCALKSALAPGDF